MNGYTCKIADISIKFKTKLKFYNYVSTLFPCQNNSVNEVIIAEKNELDEYRKLDIKIDNCTFFNAYETTLLYKKFSAKLSNYNAVLFHSATFDIDGVGVAFSARSGTGKTTHMLNWQKVLGDKMTVVNGDKPIVRFFDKDFCEEHKLEIPPDTELGIPYAYGTPWCGKEGLGTNMRTKLKHICFIERSETNYVTKIDKKDAVNRIMQQVYMPKDPVALMKTLELVDRLINSCELWIIHCNMDIESAEVAYGAIFGNGGN